MTANLDTTVFEHHHAQQPHLEVYPIGQKPPLGFVPQKMHAMMIRPENYGQPLQAFKSEVINVPSIKPDEVLVWVMAAGINFNNVWAALGKPVDVIAARAKTDPEKFHIGGSDASGIIWATGSNVRHVKIGDEVVLHCNHSCGQCPDCSGGNPLLCNEQKIWGYETNWGSFAQFTKVQAQQCMPKPKHLTWAEAAAPTLCLATAYRMLMSHTGNTVKPGDHVLVWGGAGGLGSFAIQLCKVIGAKSIAVVSSKDRGEYCRELGASGYLLRQDFDCYGLMPDPSNEPDKYHHFVTEARKFGRALWDIWGKGINPDIVFEHPGESTFPLSVYVCKPGGMVVICAGTTGYRLSIDARILWMRNKRVQGSHFASSYEANQAHKLLMNKLIDPCLGEVFKYEQLGLCHQNMLDGKTKPGNMAALINAHHIEQKD